MSHASAMLADAPAATPLTAAITGLSSEVINLIKGIQCLERVARIAACARIDARVGKILACAEGPAGPREYDRPAGRISGGGFKPGPQFQVHLAGEGIEFVRSVERQFRDAVRLGNENGVVCHVFRSLVILPCCIYRMAAGQSAIDCVALARASVGCVIHRRCPREAATERAGTGRCLGPCAERRARLAYDAEVSAL